MRYLRYALLALIGVTIIVAAVANRNPVTVRLLPEEIDAGGVGAISLPVFAVILASVITGLVLGFVLEWIREAKHRRKIDEKRREVGALRQEVSRLSDQVRKVERSSAKTPALRS
jgi:uncharacterized integral membrane protein